MRFGNSAAMFGLPFTVLRNSADAGAVGVVIAVRSVAVLMAFLVAGSVGGSRRSLVLTGTIVSSGCLAAYGAADLCSSASITLLAVLAAGQGFFAAVPQPILLALTPEIAGERDLVSANGLSRVVSSVAGLLAPALAGVALALTDPGWCLLAVSVVMLAAAAVFGGVQVPDVSQPRARSTGLRAGWRTVTSRRWIAVVIGGFTVINAIWTSWLFVIGPTFVSREMSEPTWGLLLAAQAAGFIAGGWLATRLRVRRPLVLGLMSVASAGIPPLSLAARVPLGVVVATFVISGVGVEIFAVLWQATLQSNLSARELPRVFAVDMFGSSLAMPVCQLAVGPVGTLAGARASMVVIGAAIVTCCTATALAPSVRDVAMHPEISQ